MTDPIERPDLLPSNATPRERAIADADAAIGDIDVSPVIAARDPARAPLPVLSRLAWERSVDVWDPVWPEDIKRAVTIAAPEVHRHKGTVYAVKTALAALQVDATVTEWWQEVPRKAPYTFAVRAYARARLYDGPILDTRLIRVVFASILRAKPESRAFDLTIGAKFPNTLGLAGVALGKVSRRVALYPVVDSHVGTTLGLAGVALGRTRVNACFLLRSP